LVIALGNAKARPARGDPRLHVNAHRVCRFASGGCSVSITGAFRWPSNALPCIRMAGEVERTDGAVKERVKTERREPAQYKVVLLNDDYTTMEFVIHVLETIFHKSPAEAYRVMMHVHLNGSGVAGVYPWEVAETKVETVVTMARHAEYPLRAAIEEA
jgi:ATP-dependent Clp protease adaptor protein ClpS